MLIAKKVAGISRYLTSTSAPTSTLPFVLVSASIQSVALTGRPFFCISRAREVRSNSTTFPLAFPVRTKSGTLGEVVFLDTRNGNVVTSKIVDASGTPLTVAVINTPGGGNTRNIRRPDLVPGVDPYQHGSDKRLYLNPAAFAMPAPGTYGNLARNALRGPGLVQLDLTLHKRFLFSEKMNLEFRAEIYNILNRANFSNPPSSLANALGTGSNQIQPGQAFTPAAAGGSFGVISSTVEKTVGLGAGRQIQLSLRLNF